jgi:hypothetical protein
MGCRAVRPTVPEAPTPHTHKHTHTHTYPFLLFSLQPKGVWLSGGGRQAAVGHRHGGDRPGLAGAV